ncbi:penicillin-binding protein [Paenibacillus sp. CAA11]|uniref:PBP1A family penicillin-binding protein n=1 Tax=Paenibacillus sp. CAA11 TaxID=1532905 RepID=UPI000D3AAA95|nr:PBP1A family penicillin-binding protein [Paenibacillus sp. CAA11]AWB46926.1 penicillin-binding protein [Paenibacillus sp. CAA11]
MPTQRPSRMDRNHKASDSSKDKPKKKKKKLSAKKVLWTTFFTMAFAIICGIIGYLFIMFNGEKLLRENQDKLVVYESTKVYDRGGKLMGELSIDKSEPVDSNQIPKLLKDAFVATEDKRFYEHNGVDIWSIGRAAVKDIVARKKLEGGSTITQQLAKNIFLSRDKTFFRKATEVAIATALERNKTKDEILTLYLNRINFGGTTYGIKAAAEKYFGQGDLNKLELWQMATLAAMPKGPSKYNPLRNPEASTERRGVVLDLMYEQGYITAEQRDHAKAVKYDYQPPVKKQNYNAFIDYVMDEAEDVAPELTEDQIVRGGYKIYTTMDAQAQKAVEKAFANDSLFEKSKDDQQVQGSIVIMNHENGAIVALLGGRDYERKGFSRINSRRQPGSALKPIIDYAPALETGKFTINSKLSNKKQCFGNYCPKNLHGYSDTIGMTQAITKSENIPAVWILNQIGVKTGIDYAQKMGITLDKNDSNLAVALGGLTKGTTTMEMAEAYSVLANKGRHNDPYSIKEIRDHAGTPVYQHGKPKQEQILGEDTAYYMTKMLQNVVTDGTGKKARIDRPVAGKTGTTQHGISGLKSSKNRDVWFVGYTPEWTAAIWMGYDKVDKNHLLNGSSGQTAAMFAAVMSEALKGVPVKDFDVPSKLSKPKKEEEQPVKPKGVTGLSGTYDEGTATVSLTWNGVDQAGGQYRIYRKASTDADYSLLMNVATTDAEDLTVAPATAYEYYVTYYDPATDTESDRSNVVRFEIPAVEDQNETTPPDTGNGTDPNGGNLNPGDTPSNTNQDNTGNTNQGGDSSGNGVDNNGGNSGDTGNPATSPDDQSNKQGRGKGNGKSNGRGSGSGDSPDSSGGTSGPETNSGTGDGTTGSSGDGTFAPDPSNPAGSQNAG